MNCKTCTEEFTSLKDLVKHVAKKWHSYQCSHFFCVPCALPLHKVTNVIEHIESVEHSIMILATGIRFDSKDGTPHSSSTPFPPQKCCFLCSSRDGNPFQQHMNSFTHNFTASLLRDVIRSRKIDCSEWKAKDFRTQEFLSKMVKVKQQQELDGETSKLFRDPLPFVCELCNIYFSMDECYQQHLENQSHKRMEQFMAQLFNIVKEAIIIGNGTYVEESDTFSNSLPPLYYCGLCCLWVEKTPSYVQHTQSTIHRRIEELSSKLSNKRSGNAVGLPLNTRDSLRDSTHSHSKNYCKLCAVWISSASSFHQHYRDVGHSRIERFVNSLPSGEDKNFLNVYVEAEAQMKFSDTPPKNYCELCNILHSKSENYKQHLQSEEHRHVEKHYSKGKSTTGEKASKKLKTSLSPPIHYPHNSGYEDKKTDVGCKDKETDVGYEDKEADNILDEEHYCELCEFVCYKALHYGKHLMDEKHKKMRRMLNKKGKGVSSDTNESRTTGSSHPLQYNCELCDVYNRNYQEYEFHLNNPKHKKNQWLLYVFKQKCL